MIGTKPKMIKKLLVANRGEIACRVFRTARAMGLATVAVYSEADAGAAHVADADRAVPIGPAAARESYLVPEKIIEAARVTGAEPRLATWSTTVNMYLSSTAITRVNCSPEGAA